MDYSEYYVVPVAHRAAARKLFERHRLIEEKKFVIVISNDGEIRKGRRLRSLLHHTLRARQRAAEREEGALRPGAFRDGRRRREEARAEDEEEAEEALERKRKNDRSTEHRNEHEQHARTPKAAVEVLSCVVEVLRIEDARAAMLQIAPC